METKFTRVVLGGLFATVAMTVIIFILAAAGLPEIYPPELLAQVLQISLPVGWGLHLSIGVIFALFYAYVFVYWVRNIPQRVVKGALYGVVVFLIAQGAMLGLESMGVEIPVIDGNQLLMALSILTGHVVYGIVQAQFIKTGQQVQVV